MNNTFALVTLAMICNLSFAQEKQSKFSFSAFISPTIARRILTADNTVSDDFVKRFNEIESPKLGYLTGIFASYTACDKIKIQTGLSFSNNGYLYKKSDLISDTSYLPIPVKIPTAVKIVYQYYYLDIPVQVKYIFLKRNKISFYAVTGIEANFNIANRKTVTFWYEDEKERETTDDFMDGGYEYRKYNCSVLGGVGMDVALGSKVNLFMQPTYRQMLLAIVDAPAERRLYSVGLATGATISL